MITKLMPKCFIPSALTVFLNFDNTGLKSLITEKYCCNFKQVSVSKNIKLKYKICNYVY